MKLRRATLRDLDTLVAHRRRMWEDMGYRGRGYADDHAGGDRVYRRWLATRMRSGKVVAWAVTDAGRVVASGCLWLQEVQPRPGYDGPWQPYLLSMFTEPTHRGRGLATKIVRESMRWAKTRGFPKLSLHASKFGLPIYEKLGFKRTWEMKLDFRSKRARGRLP
ncbi:MAG: GNAT family N-acetyltransferase [Methanobacteriota archaeon]